MKKYNSPESEIDNGLEDDLTDDLDGALKHDLNSALKHDLDGALKDDLDGELEDDLDGALKDDLDGELEDDLDGELEDHLNGALEDHLDSALEDHLDSALEDHLDGALEDDEFEDTLKNNLKPKVVNGVKINTVQDREQIEWNQSLSVHIPEIDELQNKMFTILNGLINQQDKDDELAKDSLGMMAEVTEYSRYYFSKEEEYLRKCGYPDIECHSKEHRQFIKNTINVRRQVAEDKNYLSYNTVIALKDWIVNHIFNTDHLYVPFIRINNYIEDCRIKRSY